jgi:hypothetical protein
MPGSHELRADKAPVSAVRMGLQLQLQGPCVSCKQHRWRSGRVAVLDQPCSCSDRGRGELTLSVSVRGVILLPDGRAQYG